MPKQFWKTQPVAKGEQLGAISRPDSVSPKRVELRDGFTWAQNGDIPQIVMFLRENYVEDLDSTFRLSYSEEFFRYLFEDPHHRDAYSLALNDQTGMVGYLLAKKHTLSINALKQDVVSINFLCLAKKYRNRFLAPLLIREITRIANTFDVYQGVFTSQKDYGFSISTVTYYHLPLNGLKLMECQYIDEYMADGRDYRMRNSTFLAAEESLGDICKLYEKEMAKYKFHEELPAQQLAYVMKNRSDVFYTLYNPEHAEFASIFIINTYCIQKSVSFRVAYLYYWSGSLHIVEDAIAFLRSMDVDLFNVLNLGRNMEIIGSFGMLEGTGSLRYHLFNWKENNIENEDLNFILF